MKELVKFEYRKLWNKVTIVAVVALCVLSILHTVIFLNLQWRSIDEKGEIISGLAAFRALKSATEEIEGTIDGDYLQTLIHKFDSSVDKQYLLEHRGFLGTGGMTKYMYPNYFINFAYYGSYMSNGNDKMGLEYDFLDSEAHFYQKYREAVKENRLYLNEYTALMKYSDEQIIILENQIDGVKTPFKFAYHQGIANILNWFNMQYPIFFVVISLALACIYAKDNTSGVDELTLSTTNGRKKDFRAKWLAGNLFTIVSYLIFIGVLIFVHAAIASLHGWGTSAQLYWFYCIYNISIGTGLLMKLSGGLLGALVAANFVMLLSTKFKNTKLSSITSLIIVGLIVNLSKSYSQAKLFYPLQFGSDAVVRDCFILGNLVIPYYTIVYILTFLYVTIICLFMKNTYKMYFIH